MKLTPLDIRHKEFRRSMRGYSEEEVDVFLDEVADEFERLFQQNIDTQERIQRLEEQVTQYEKLKDTLQATMVTAQQQADEMRANARKESELTLKDAELKGRDIVGESYAEKQRVQQSLIQLRQVEEDFRFKFRSLLEAHLNLLAEDEVSEDRRQFRGLVATVEQELVEEQDAPEPGLPSDVPQPAGGPFPWTAGDAELPAFTGDVEVPAFAGGAESTSPAESAPEAASPETAGGEHADDAPSGIPEPPEPAWRAAAVNEAVVDTSVVPPVIDSAPSVAATSNDETPAFAVPTSPDGGASSDVEDDFFGRDERSESSVRRFLFGKKGDDTTAVDEESDDREFKW